MIRPEILRHPTATVGIGFAISLGTIAWMLSTKEIPQITSVTEDEITATEFLQYGFVQDTVSFGDSGSVTGIDLPDTLEATYGDTVSPQQSQVVTIHPGACREFTVESDEGHTGVRVVAEGTGDQTEPAYMVQADVEVASRDEGHAEVCVPEHESSIRAVIGLSVSPVEELTFDDDIVIDWGNTEEFPAPYVLRGGWDAYPESANRLNSEISGTDARFIGAYQPIDGLHLNFFQAGYGRELDINGEQLPILLENIFEGVEQASDSPFRTRVMNMLNENGRLTREVVANIFISDQPDGCYERNGHQIINPPPELQQIQCESYTGVYIAHEDTRFSTIRVSSNLVSQGSYYPYTGTERELDDYFSWVIEEYQQVLAHELLHALIAESYPDDRINRQELPVDYEHIFIEQAVDSNIGLLSGPDGVLQVIEAREIPL